MKYPEACEQNCAFARTLALIGENWTLLVLRQIMFLHQHSFDQIQESLEISPHVLSMRLKRLHEAGILEKKRDPNSGRSYIYSLTDKGYDLFPVMLGILKWGEEHAVMDGPKPPKIGVHDSCGKPLKSNPTCPSCKETITARNFTLATP